MGQHLGAQPSDALERLSERPADPYAIYEHLRDRGPVSQLSHGFAVSTFEAVQSALRDRRFSSALRPPDLASSKARIAERLGVGELYRLPALMMLWTLIQRVAVDENHHFLFYRDLVGAWIEKSPSTAVCSLDVVVRDFHMPGVGIPDFRHHAAVMAKANIYNWTIHLEQVIEPLLRHWGIEALEGLTSEAELARERLLGYINRLRRVAIRLDGGS